eukprot:m.303494 g.303494  ORF g.303494 m.303494 type:complete len:389 (-) comp15951_c0_seq1:232-1398(-)
MLPIPRHQMAQRAPAAASTPTATLACAVAPLRLAAAVLLCRPPAPTSHISQRSCRTRVRHRFLQAPWAAVGTGSSTALRARRQACCARAAASRYPPLGRGLYALSRLFAVRSVPAAKVPLLLVAAARHAAVMSRHRLHEAPPLRAPRRRRPRALPHPLQRYHLAWAAAVSTERVPQAHHRHAARRIALCPRCSQRTSLRQALFQDRTASPRASPGSTTSRPTPFVLRIGAFVKSAPPLQRLHTPRRAAPLPPRGAALQLFRPRRLRCAARAPRSQQFQRHTEKLPLPLPAWIWGSGSLRPRPTRRWSRPKCRATFAAACSSHANRPARRPHRPLLEHPRLHRGTQAPAQRASIAIPLLSLWPLNSCLRAFTHRFPTSPTCREFDLTHI